MERLEENTIPVEGTIYYEGDNMETLYVAQAIDDNEQYQYDNATIEQDEQMSWEPANPESNQNQEEDSSQVTFLVKKLTKCYKQMYHKCFYFCIGSDIFT